MKKIMTKKIVVPLDSFHSELSIEHPADVQSHQMLLSDLPL
jgi:hypothetical protein